MQPKRSNRFHSFATSIIFDFGSPLQSGRSLKPAARVGLVFTGHPSGGFPDCSNSIVAHFAPSKESARDMRVNSGPAPTGQHAGSLPERNPIHQSPKNFHIRLPLEISRRFTPARTDCRSHPPPQQLAGPRMSPRICADLTRTFVTTFHVEQTGGWESG